ncbi:MAG: hypothetical protein A3J83_03335 [Elusimicrobia bacterium RIFOXYA2_FULL_40_6]|nr:MAG: hypothetical protein A3J83_03335 [Elusimicrobia bacterium RIFOXYA2_FULL_40_6]
MKKNIIALLIFAVVTLIMTYPAALNMKKHIPGDLGDPLYVTWALSWNTDKIYDGFKDYWDANIFYPNKLTLAYSENVLGIALAGLPVMLLTNNVVLSYNIMFLLAFILSGFGVYLLTKHLTGSFWGSIIAGIIFSFAPYRFGYLGQLPVLTAQWVPFGFLYLHKYFKGFKSKHLVLFVFFFIIQWLSCLYNGIFMTVFVVLFMLYYGIRNGSIKIKYLLMASMTLLFVLIFLIIFMHPYSEVKKQYGFKRSAYEAEYYSLHVESYLALPQLNKMHGIWTKGGVSAGFVGLLLAIIGFWPGIKLNTYFNNRYKLLRRFWCALFYLNIAIIAWYVINGGQPINIFGKNMLGNPGKTNPVSCLLALIFIRLCFDKNLRQSVYCFIKSINLNEKFYFITAVTAILLSFGPTIQFFNESSIKGPYAILYNYIPGFDGIRVVLRIQMFVFLGLSVLAAYGYEKLSKKWGKKDIFGALLAVLILIEYSSFPISVCAVKTDKDIPAVYNWLGSQKEDFAIIEVPLKFSDPFGESLRMYYSTYHRKKMINGYSGYFPPVYMRLAGLNDAFPSNEYLDILRKEGVKYVVINSDKYPGTAWAKIRESLNKYRGKIIFVQQFDSDFVYQIQKG